MRVPTLVIESIIRSLENGRDQLKWDIMTLEEDQKSMRVITKKIEKAVRIGQLVDAKPEEKLREMSTDPERYKFISEEILFPLRQRIIDLQQHLAVNQQGVLASEIVIRNDKELTRGVDRTLETVDAVNKTTGSMIADTAKRLRTQGTQIHKQAVSAQIEVAQLKAAFVDV